MLQDGKVIIKDGEPYIDLQIMKNKFGPNDVLEDINGTFITIQDGIIIDIVTPFQCGVWHFDEPRIGIKRNGGNLIWQQEVIDTRQEPPTLLFLGARYLIIDGTGIWSSHNQEIAEWDGSAWQYESPYNDWAVWSHNGVINRDNWEWYEYDGQWSIGGQLYDFPKFAPGPFFRDCDITPPV